MKLSTNALESLQNYLEQLSTKVEQLDATSHLSEKAIAELSIEAAALGKRAESYAARGLPEAAEISRMAISLLIRVAKLELETTELREASKQLSAEQKQLAKALRVAVEFKDKGLFAPIMAWLGRRMDSALGTGPDLGEVLCKAATTPMSIAALCEETVASR